MNNFEIILDHLGPTAKPLMDFLDLADAKNMLTVSKYTSSLVLTHFRRWGFKMPPYMEYTDGTFAITIRGETTKFKPVKPHHTLMFDRVASRTVSDDRTHVLVIHGCRTTRLIHGTRSEIKRILVCANLYKLKRELRLKKESLGAPTYP
jgi:hypothetical protein